MYEVAKGTPVIGHGIAAGHAFAGKVEKIQEVKQPGFDSITFSENSNYERESLLEV